MNELDKRMVPCYLHHRAEHRGMEWWLWIPRQRANA